MLQKSSLTHHLFVQENLQAAPLKPDPELTMQGNQFQLFNIPDTPPFTPKHPDLTTFDSFEDLLQSPNHSLDHSIGASSQGLSPLLKNMAMQLQQQNEQMFSLQLQQQQQSVLLGGQPQPNDALQQKGRRRAHSLYDVPSPKMAMATYDTSFQMPRRASLNEGRIGTIAEESSQWPSETGMPDFQFLVNHKVQHSLDQNVNSSQVQSQQPSTFPPAIVYTCDHAGCGKQFDKYQNLKSHVKSHSVERPFACSTCDARFSRNHDLKRHERIHSGVRPYSCEFCKKTFLRLDALNRHLKVNNGRGCRSRIKKSDLDTLSEDAASVYNDDVQSYYF